MIRHIAFGPHSSVLKGFVFLLFVSILKAIGIFHFKKYKFAFLHEVTYPHPIENQPGSIINLPDLPTLYFPDSATSGKTSHCSLVLSSN